MPPLPKLVIRHGTIVDGSGADPFEADVAISNGRITEIGRALPKGAEEIDARGKLVTPGFVDVHTHYDAQATWSSRLSPSSWNGVTTVMMGNCGVGFAPCHPEQRDMLVKLMEGVEDIPEVVLTEGLPWTWKTFPEFLDTLEARHYDADIATQVPHAALRIYVMGQRGADREPATELDRQRMAEIAVEGVRAGALGFSTSRMLNHRTLDGKHIPTLRAEEAELTAIAHGERHLEVRVGNVETVDGSRQVFGSVARAETDITALIQRTLKTVGRTGTTKVTAFTDGCPGLRKVLVNADVTKPPILDWFHIAMRLQHTKLAAANLSTDSPDRVTAKAVIIAEVERLHWRIWNGKAKNARHSISRIRKVMHVFKGERSRGAKGVASRKLWHALHAVDKYLRGQAAWLINYAKRYRAADRVGTSITEGTANFLVNRRMNKSQQMR